MMTPTIRGTILKYVEIGSVCTLAGFLFWPHAVSSVALITSLVIALVRYGRSALPPRSAYFLLLPGLLILVSWILHGFAPKGLAEVQLWLTPLAAWVYFYRSPFHQLFKRSFIVWSALQVLFTAGIAWMHWDDSYSLVSGLRTVIDLHTKVHVTHMAAAWAWAALWLVVDPAIIHQRHLRSFLVTLFVATVLVLGSRMPIVALMVGSTVGVVIIPSLKPVRWWYIGGIVLIPIVMVLVSPSLRARFDEVSQTTSSAGEKWTPTQLRLGVLDCVIEVSAAHFWTGVGTGHTRHALDACYATFETDQFFETEYNSHNQFLHYQLTGGIVSLSAFLGFFVVLFKRAYRAQNHLLIVFGVFVGLLFLTENYFSRQGGMMWFSFVLMVLYYRHQASRLSASGR